MPLSGVNLGAQCLQHERIYPPRLDFRIFRFVSGHPRQPSLVLVIFTRQLVIQSEHVAELQFRVLVRGGLREYVRLAEPEDVLQKFLLSPT